MKIHHSILILIAISATLSGCFGPVKTQPPSAYVISATPQVYPAQVRNRTAVLMVSVPETNPAYNTTQMAYSIKPYQISYFSHNQWAETPAQMLQPLMVQTLQSTHHYHAVITPPYIGRYDYELSTRISRLEQDFTDRPTSMNLSIHAQLSRTATNRIVATRDFTVSVPIRHGSPYNGVLAANRAAAIILAEIAEFCVRNTK